MAVGQKLLSKLGHICDYCVKYDASHRFIKPIKMSKLFVNQKAIYGIYQRKCENRAKNYLWKVSIFQKHSTEK